MDNVKETSKLTEFTTNLEASTYGDDISLFSETPHVSRTKRYVAAAPVGVQLQRKMLNKRIDRRLNEIQKKRHYIRTKNYELKNTESYLQNHLRTLMLEISENSETTHISDDGQPEYECMQNESNFRRFSPRRIPTIRSQRRHLVKRPRVHSQLLLNFSSANSSDYVQISENIGFRI
ncbi:hypothetical protein SNE40_001211 [Patella caerulea]|uniref:Uncharacterized protein n=1 Tax=Patella caerulea TaxID=87958 RepID=A0AAN8KE31_PATCE